MQPIQIIFNQRGRDENRKSNLEHPILTDFFRIGKVQVCSGLQNQGT